MSGVLFLLLSPLLHWPTLQQQQQHCCILLLFSFSFPQCLARQLRFPRHGRCCCCSSCRLSLPPSSRSLVSRSSACSSPLLQVSQVVPPVWSSSSSSSSSSTCLSFGHFGFFVVLGVLACCLRLPASFRAFIPARDLYLVCLSVACCAELADNLV